MKVSRKTTARNTRVCVHVRPSMCANASVCVSFSCMQFHASSPVNRRYICKKMVGYSF